MQESTTFLGTKIAVSTLPNGAVAAYTFTKSLDNLDTQITTVKVDVKDKAGEIVSWGKKNNYPQEIINAVKINGAASSGLKFLRKAHYGNGLILVRDQVDENGKKTPKIVPLTDVSDINDFFIKSQMNRFWKETIMDLEWFSIAFPEYILSENFKTINRVKRHRTAWCRFEVMNKDNGLVEHVYISEKFGKENVSIDSEFVEKVPLIDSYWSVDQVREYCKANNIKKFIRPIFYPLLDEAFYPQAEWHSVVKSGWLDVANSVPALKKALFTNQMTVKYLIEIDERYFEALYKENWATMKPDERNQIRQGIINTINDSLTGNENAGKSIQSMQLVGNDGQAYSAVTITTIDDKLKDGSYLPEAEAANSEILFALCVDSSLIGAGIPGGKLGAGSGSDKRVAFDILSALFKTNRETTLEVYDFIAQYNNWDNTIKPAFENTIITTLDANPTGTKNATT